MSARVQATLQQDMKDQRGSSCVNKVRELRC